MTNAQADGLTGLFSAFLPFALTHYSYTHTHALVILHRCHFFQMNFKTIFKMNEKEQEILRVAQQINK